LGLSWVGTGASLGGAGWKRSVWRIMALGECCGCWKSIGARRDDERFSGGLGGDVAGGVSCVRLFVDGVAGCAVSGVW
jgi:hypothetical protein